MTRGKTRRQEHEGARSENTFRDATRLEHASHGSRSQSCQPCDNTFRGSGDGAPRDVSMLSGSRCCMRMAGIADGMRNADFAVWKNIETRILEPQLQPWSLGALEPLARGPLSDPGPNLRQSIFGNLPWAPEGPLLSRKPLKTKGFMGFLTSHQPLTLQKTLKCLERHGFSGNHWNQKIFKVLINLLNRVEIQKTNVFVSLLGFSEGFSVNGESENP